MQRSPRRSARKHEIALHISDRSVRRFLLADLKFHPYKIQVVQFPSDHDKTVCLEFCHCLRELITEYSTFINNLVMSDESHFHVNGSVNKQQMQYWDPANLCQLHQRPLHDPKVRVLFTVMATKLIGPYFLRTTMGKHVL